MIVLAPSFGSCRIRLSYMQAAAPRTKMVPAWWISKCGARSGMPWRSTPPDLALGSGALSLKAEPSNFSGSGAAKAKEGDSPKVPAAMAALLLKNLRRFHHGWRVFGSVMTFLPVVLFLYERHAG